MNLLTDDWVSVRSLSDSKVTKPISLQTLFCGNEKWLLSLPRDDMELATLQLLICIAQALLIPSNRKEWAKRISKPLSEEVLIPVIRDHQDWFQLDHAEFPFMQVKGVKANIITPMDKLLAGLDSSTNSRFVNEPGLANGLCFGCTAVALYNLANNAPSFGGGFKYGLRGSCPVSTFSQGQDLRATIWMNVLSEESLDEYMPEWKKQLSQAPTWVDPIVEKANIPANNIGFLRGLFWQPGYTELLAPEIGGQCSCCGYEVDKLYTGFKKAKFNYTIDGFFIHPHSPQLMAIKKGNTETSYLSFTMPVPAWTQLSRYVLERSFDQVSKNEKAHRPALVIKQIKKYLGENKAARFELLVGGYRNNQAAIVERRHEVITLKQGWEKHAEDVHHLVGHALKYKTMLRKSLYICAKGINGKSRKLKGVGADLHEIGEFQFYHRSEGVMTHAFASIDFNDLAPTYLNVDQSLRKICYAVFDELTVAYQHDPELFRTLAVARRSLQKNLRELSTSDNKDTV